MGIAVAAYSPLGYTNSPLAQNAVVKKVAEKKNVATYAVFFSIWANMDQISVLSKSVTAKRMRGEVSRVQ